MLYFVLIVAVALAVVAFFVLSWWGGAVVLIAGILFAVYVSVARSQDRSVGTVETGARREPTGVPRSGSSGAETANERVGQD
jgi:uncharacterized membrane protein YgcG